MLWLAVWHLVLQNVATRVRSVAKPPRTTRPSQGDTLSREAFWMWPMICTRTRTSSRSSMEVMLWFTIPDGWAIVLAAHEMTLCLVSHLCQSEFRSKERGTRFTDTKSLQVVSNLLGNWWSTVNKLLVCHFTWMWELLSFLFCKCFGAFSRFGRNYWLVTAEKFVEVWYGFKVQTKQKCLT